MIFRIVPSQKELDANFLGSGTIEHASRCFRSDGALIADNIIASALIAEARETFWKKYSQSCVQREDVAKVGEQRFMITIRLERPFSSPELFANPFILPIIASALGKDFVIGAFGVICALPSAPAQHVHHDGGNLFSGDIDGLLPAAAVTVGIPLVEMNAVNGTTKVWLGSHRSRNDFSNRDGIEPVVHEGSCILWDFRLKHGGTENKGSLPRPLLYLTYCRPWFMDHINFGNKVNTNPKQKALIASKDVLAALSDTHQRLLMRAQLD
jgi:ectoine hydroxylase-related dioxygenase (phytanoyl-CoA dioxygenase family)